MKFAIVLFAVIAIALAAPATQTVVLEPAVQPQQQVVVVQQPRRAGVFSGIAGAATSVVAGVGGAAIGGAGGLLSGGLDGAVEGVHAGANQGVALGGNVAQI